MLDDFIDSVTSKSLRQSATIDAEDFSSLYREHLDAVFNYCLFRVGDRAVAEDLTAEAFERAWRARARYRPERAAFSTWLFTIVRRLVIDWYRRQDRHSTTALDTPVPDDNPTPEAQLEEAESLAHLRDLVLQLQEHEQELIALKFGAGMTNRRIAEVIGKSESAVGTAIYRIVKKLRAAWKDT